MTPEERIEQLRFLSTGEGDDAEMCANVADEMEALMNERDEYKGMFLAVDAVLAKFFDRPNEREDEDIAVFIRRERVELLNEVARLRKTIEVHREAEMEIDRPIRLHDYVLWGTIDPQGAELW